jgi:predicted dienelactone hydrolase
MGKRFAPLLAAMAVAALGSQAFAGPVGERHLTATNPTAALRDDQHRDTVRVTVWYPAAADAQEASLDIGPPGKPLFLVGSAAPDAAFADARRRPVILFSHGFGGTARMMAWFTLPLVRAGPQRLQAFCNANPTDGICMPQKEFPLSTEQMLAAAKSPELAPELAHATDDHAVPGVRAAFAIAPAIVQSFDPASLKADQTPVAIILGDADPVAPPHTNGLVAAQDLPHVELKVLPGVGHYDFLATCTPAGVAAVPVCADKVPQDPSHHAAIDMALAFFARTLGRP